MKIGSWLAAVTVSLGVSVSAVQALTLNVVGGQLMGASGVDVNGSLYDVEFLDGTCVALFDGCDAVSDFTFQTQVDAEAASQALLDQVLLDGPQGNFDSDPGLTNGIGAGAHVAFLVTPFGLSPGYVSVMGVQNNPIGVDEVWISTNDYEPLDDFGNWRLDALARWSPTASAIPLPAGGWLLLSGLAGMTGLRRWKKRSERT